MAYPLEDALEEIDACQNDIYTLSKKASEEILKIEQKYKALSERYFQKRNEVIKRVPNFWLTAFVNFRKLYHIVQEEEAECLKFLDRLEVERFYNIKDDFRIHFYFVENPYFENKVLTKEFNLGSSGEQPVSTSTPIQWKPDRDLTNVFSEKEKAERRKHGLDCRTFFSWFTDKTNRINDDIAELIKDDLWPNPLKHYLRYAYMLVESDSEEDKKEEEKKQKAIWLTGRRFRTI